MKKIITCGIAATLCAAALSAQAFAADIIGDRSIYAENAEELAAKIKCVGFTGVNTHLDPKTIMPVYHADIYDFVTTGELKLTPATRIDDGYHMYYGDVVDDNGKFVGIAYFYDGDDNIMGGIPEYSFENSDTHDQHWQRAPLDFHLYADEVKSIMLANGLSTDVKEVRFAIIEGVGTVYYIDNGTDKMLMDIRGTSFVPYPGYFDEDTEIFLLNEENRQIAAQVEGDRRRGIEEFLKEHPEGGAGGAGGSTSNDTSKTDVPNTGSTAQAFAGVIALGALTAAAVTVVKRRKKD